MTSVQDKIKSLLTKDRIRWMMPLALIAVVIAYLVLSKHPDALPFLYSRF